MSDPSADIDALIEAFPVLKLAPKDQIIPPGSLTRSDFEAWLQKDFEVPFADTDPLPLTLDRIDDPVSTYRKGGYSLVLSGPSDRYFQQGSVPIKLPDGRYILAFLVNHGPLDGRMQYQLVSN
ncbi:MAG: DUF6916 family protein [Rhodospirillaceae bacterium]